jgi:uncharacterized protein (TIGR03382 family)
MLLALLLSSPAHATWSIVAADPDTGEVGGAGTSCVGGLDVAVIFGSAPGVGAVHAQAQLSTAGRDEAVRRLDLGESPDAILAAITDAAFDRSADRRQYGIVDTQGRSAAWTGALNGDWAGDQQGTTDGLVYSVQGNILTGEGVVARTAASFQLGGACDLPERLLVALTAGRADGEGDSRCTSRGVPSDSAFLRVQDQDGVDIVSLSVTGTGNDDPLERLRVELDAWRADNPCPVVDPGDTDTDTGQASTGCGCSGTGASVGWLALLGLAFLRRRG